MLYKGRLRHEYYLERSNLNRSLHVRNRTVRHHRIYMGGRAVKSYRDYLALKGLKPIVIERTAKQKGDKVLVASCKPVQVVK